jgi:RNA polymerase sigma factor (sigma-70 family)
LDPLLESYTKCDEAAACERLLQEIVERARPTIEKTVRRRLAFSATAEAQDRDDVQGEVIVELLRRLRALRDGDNTVPIESFTGYVGAASHHACDEYLRRKYPQRRRLKNKIRYVLSTEPRFAVWESSGSESNEWLCGLRVWQFRAEKRIVLTSEVLQAVNGVGGAGRSRQGVVTMLAGIFDSLQGPILLEELVGIVARLWGISDHSMAIDPERAVGSVPPSQESDLLQRRDLERLWSEVRELPVPQRVALLLNLRGDKGDSPILFLPVLGVAGIRQIAEALDIPAEEFSNLWGRLPLDDQAIASRLGVTRQQVINLRKSARERLRRRMADHNKVGVAR